MAKVALAQITSEQEALETRLSALEKDYIAEHIRLYERFASAKADIEEQIKAVQARNNVPMSVLVLVRHTSGPPVKCFHSARYPCDRVWRRGNYTEMSIGEAVHRGLEMCNPCNWNRHIGEERAKRQ